MLLQHIEISLRPTFTSDFRVRAAILLGNLILCSTVLIAFFIPFVTTHSIGLSNHIYYVVFVKLRFIKWTVTNSRIHLVGATSSSSYFQDSKISWIPWMKIISNRVNRGEIWTCFVLNIVSLFLSPINPFDVNVDNRKKATFQLDYVMSISTNNVMSVTEFFLRI